MLPSLLRARPTVVGAIGCALAVALAVGLGGELSPTAHVAVLAAGAVVVGVALAHRAGAGSPPVGSAARPELAGLAAVLAWEAWALADEDLPTLSDLLDPVLAPPAARTTATLVWLAAGAWLATRPGATLGSAMRSTAGRVVVLAAWLWLGLHFLAR